MKNALIWNSGDDAVDTDQAWAGTLDNFIVIAGSNTDHALEIDGPEGSYTNAGHTVKNGSIKGNPASEFADFRAGAKGTFENLYFFGFPSPDDNNAAGRGDLSLSGDATIANFTGGSLKFSALQATLKDGVTLTKAFRNGTDVHATSVAAQANTVGATKAAFSGWTWASAANQLADFK